MAAGDKTCPRNIGKHGDSGAEEERGIESSGSRGRAPPKALEARLELWIYLESVTLGEPGLLVLKVCRAAWDRGLTTNLRALEQGCTEQVGHDKERELGSI